jgi:flagellar motor switch protein FliG
MFLFENLLDLDDASINVILNQVDQNTLVIALKGAAPDLQQKFTGQMSVRAAEMFREDMESRGPIRMSQVEAEQKVILEAVRRLAASGEIVIGSGDDSYV